MTTYENLRTSELSVGDVVRCHGLRCLIDSEIQVSKIHGEDDGRGSVRYVRALVLNREEIPSSIVPNSWTKGGNPRGNNWPENEHRWTIQGNDLAWWTVER